MTDFSRNYDFSTKDVLATGNPSKLIKGSEVDAEFDDIATMSATKANKAVPSSANNVALLSASGDLVDSGGGIFPTGTAMLFYQSAAPTGWTKTTTAGLDNHALRVVTSTGWTSGTQGTNSFTDVLGSGAAVSTDGHALITSELASHTHNSGATRVIAVTPTATDVARLSLGDTSAGIGGAVNTSSTGSGSAHSHTLSVDVNYLDLIIATKD